MPSPNPAVVDANVLFDFRAGAALAALVRLPGGVVVTDLVLAEPRAEDQREIMNAGVRVRSLDEQQVQDLARLAASERKLSTQDLSAFILARDDELVLLTGEKALRAYAEAAGVEVHGTIWVLDELITAQALAPEEAADALERMMDAGRRLPPPDSRAAIARWRRRPGR